MNSNTTTNMWTCNLCQKTVQARRRQAHLETGRHLQNSRIYTEVSNRYQNNSIEIISIVENNDAYINNNRLKELQNWKNHILIAARRSTNEVECCVCLETKPSIHLCCIHENSGTCGGCCFQLIDDESVIKCPLCRSETTMEIKLRPL